MLLDNPAARLLAILQQGSEHKNEANCRGVWTALLDTGGNNTLLMSRLGKVMNLPAEIIQTLDQEFPHQSGAHAHWSNQVNRGFMEQNLNGRWDTFSKFIDQHTLSYLSLSADLLQSKANTSLLNETTLQDTRDKIDGVLKDVLESDFPDEIKNYLVRGLQRIIVAVDEYRISGAAPILDAMEITLGHAFFDAEYRRALTNTDIGRTIVDGLASVASSITIAVGLPQLPETFQLLLGNH